MLIILRSSLSLLFVSGSYAHFFIKTPVPIAASAIKNPLNPSGSDFPCHGANLAAVTQRTSMAADSTQMLEFELGGGANTAVHGGGSCQISITYESDPIHLKDPDSWKVIKSFVGGCPTNAPGNLEPSAELCTGSNGPKCVKTLSFKVPPQVKNGPATLAWTWFNNIGNREMYMNCAAIDVTGGQNDISSLPTMFVANLRQPVCSTTENYNTEFPDPGKFVQTAEPLNYPLKLPVGAGCGSHGGINVTTTAGSSAPTMTGPAVSSLSSVSNSRMPSAALSAEITRTLPAGTTGTMPRETNSNTGQDFDTISCNVTGFFCISESTFGLCVNGYAVPRRVAAGTSCKNHSIQ